MKERNLVDREIRIKISPEGKVEIDSSVYSDCKEVADHFAEILGKVELITVKDDLDSESKIKIDSGD